MTSTYLVESMTLLCYGRMHSKGSLLWMVLLLSTGTHVTTMCFSTRLATQQKPVRFTRREKSSLPQSSSSDGISVELVDALELDGILEQVARHAGTRRGRHAFLALVGQNRFARDKKNARLSALSSKQRRYWRSPLGRPTTQPRKQKAQPTVPIAQSASDALKAYEWTEQALKILDETNSLTIPPIYGADRTSPLDFIAEVMDDEVTDHDDWIEFSSMDDWTLEDILQAEQVIGKLLLPVYEWAHSSEALQSVAPLFADLALNMDVQSLRTVHQEIEGAVRWDRVRSLVDPTGRTTFSFQLSMSKYRVLDILREKQQDLRDRVNKRPDLSEELVAIGEELQAKEEDIKCGLVQTVCSQLEAIDRALYIVSQMDVAIAKAAFGKRLNGHVPRVESEGCIHVKNFVHPLLRLQSTTDHAAATVPIDLELNSRRNGKHALIISGPNGGGKTLAMKSFGVACMLCKLGIPIPSTFPDQASNGVAPTDKPHVDFFKDILVSIGDGQDLASGESTFTAQLNTYATLINRAGIENNTSPSSTLILIDELGSGTEANAGGAIGQAVLESLLNIDSCRVVATTHSTRLKAMAYESDNFECAAALLEARMQSRHQLPSFQLQYGLIGESYAFGAALRSSLPDEVLSRACEIMEEGEDAKARESSAYTQTLARSLQQQLELASDSGKVADKLKRDMAQCHRGMLSLASAYDHHLAMLENRVERCYQDLLKDQDICSLAVMGETLNELRIVQKQVKSEKEVLRERGLRLIPDDHSLSEGESVVIVAEGEWDGITAEVISVESMDVAVRPSVGIWSLSTLPDSLTTATFKRYELAFWDYDSVLDTRSDNAGVKSLQDSKRRLHDILSNIRSSAPTQSTMVTANCENPGNKFKSSRERKASRKMKRKRK